MNGSCVIAKTAGIESTAKSRSVSSITIIVKASFELLPGCEPLPPQDPRFYECYRDVGDFPEVDQAAWFTLSEARIRILPSQIPILDCFEQKRAQAR